MPPRLRRSTFRVIALLSLALPIGATYVLAPRAVRWTGATEASLEVRVLVTVVVLLLVVLPWAAALLPLRAMTDMEKLTDELARLRAGGVQAQRDQLERLGRSRDPADRRRYHATMAAGAVIVAAGAGFVTWLTLAGDGGLIFLSLPVAAVVGVVLAVHHLLRWRQAAKRGTE